MKLIHLLVVIAFLGISASVALADGVPADPIVFTKGCGGAGQPACDAALIGPGGTAPFSATFSCTTTTVTSCFASEDFLNLSGATITSFNLDLNPVSVNGNPLVFACGSAIFSSFVCTQDSALVFTFSGGSLCPTDSNDVQPISGSPGQFNFVPDGDASDDLCSGITIAMQGSTTVTNDPFLRGVTVTGGVSTPEPGSGLLLLFGLMAGMVGVKYLRNM